MHNLGFLAFSYNRKHAPQEKQNQKEYNIETSDLLLIVGWPNFEKIGFLQRVVNAENNSEYFKIRNIGGQVTN